MNKCVLCKQGFCKSCRGKPCDCTHVKEQIEITNDRETVDNVSDDDNRPRGSRRLKRDDALKDQQSTGRKRAARFYPFLYQEGYTEKDGKEFRAACEWRNLKNCGGGLYPIKGCINGKQEARHHGPDKSVSNNDKGNVHRICHRCHNRWHAANDKDYDWNRTVYPPHKPTPMTEEEKFWVAVEDEDKTFKPIKD